MEADNPATEYSEEPLADDAGAGAAAQSSPSDPSATAPQGEAYTPRTLRTELARRGRLPLDECIEIGIRICSALQHLHSTGLVHRDVKPSNIIFVEGVPKLADIGLVTSMTEARSYVGTEGFIPPEGPGTPEADIYSLGKVLYEAVTGKDRNDFPEPATMVGESEDQAKLREFNTVILRACECDPRDRYQSAEQMYLDMVLLKAGRSITQSPRFERRVALLMRAVLIVSCLSVLLTIAFVHTRNLLLRAWRAEQDANARLWDSYVSQAQAIRWSGHVGRRFKALDAVRKATAIRPALALRNEAIAAMALSDVCLSKQWSWNIDPPGTTFDQELEWCAHHGGRGDITVYSIREGKRLFTLQGPGKVPWVSVFSPDRRYLAVKYGTGGDEMWVWNLEKRHVSIQVSQGVSEEAMAISVDSQLLAVGNREGKISLYDLSKAEVRHTITAMQNPQSLAIHPERPWVAVGSKVRGRIEIFDYESGNLVAALDQPSGLRHLDWSPDGNLLGTAGLDLRGYIWHVASARLQAVLEGHHSVLTRIKFHPTEDVVFTSSWDGTSHFWNPATGAPLLHLMGAASAFDRAGRAVAIANGSEFSIWELVIRPESRIFKGTLDRGPAPREIGISPDGRLAATACADGVRIWDIRGEKLVAHIPGREVGSALFVPNRGLIVCGDEGLSLWPVTEEVSEAGMKLRVGPPQQLLTDKQTGLRSSADVAPSGLAIVNLPDQLALMDLSTRSVRAKLNRQPGCDNVAISTDARWIAAGNWHGSGARIWDVESYSCLKELLPDDFNIDVKFSPDNRWLVTTSRDGIRFWETGTWQPRHQLQQARRGNMFGTIAFTHDSKMAATSAAPSVVQLIDTATGELIATLDADVQKPIGALGFTPDGATLLVALADHQMQMWDLRAIRLKLAAMGLDWSADAITAVTNSIGLVVAVEDGREAQRR